MQSMNFPVVPARVLLLALTGAVIAALVTVWVALQIPWIGASLSASGDDTVIVAAVRPDGPSRHVPAGSILVSVSGPAHPEGIALRASDLIEEPDFFDEFAQMNEFYARQSMLAELLRGPFQATLRTAAGNSQEARITPGKRPITSLPAPFWFQIAVSCVGFLIACWVWALRPQDVGARMFALTGLAFPAFALPAAIYSTRELALAGDTFRMLSVMNHSGAFAFGCALLALFLSYPRQLVRPRLLWILPVVYGAWLVADTFQLVPDQNWSRAGILSEMIGAVLLAGIQWWIARGHPLDRAALRWFALSTLVGSGLFVFSTVGATVLGMFPPIPQAYAFGYFLIIYVGLAFGLRRYRLFALDRWAYRILLWLAGALAVVLMDAALIIWLQLNPEVSLGITVLLCGALYFPFRQWLWLRLTGESERTVPELFPELIRIAFSVSKHEQEARWDALLRQLYDPLEVQRFADDAAATDVVLFDSGLALSFPACGGVSGRTLRLASRGRRLFGLRDLGLAQSLAQLMRNAAEGRNAYERGVQEERVRIARDMHDDIGARLLMLIHHAQRGGDATSAEVARAAMGDLRTTLSALEGQHMPLPDALADWRAEMSARCEAANVQFGWTQLLPGNEVSGESAAQFQRTLSPRQKATLERVLRETLSNALKHARPSCVSVDVGALRDSLVIRISNDDMAMRADDALADAAEPISPKAWQEGRGLRGMRGRLGEFGGQFEVEQSPGRSCIAIEMPLGAGHA